MKSAPPLKSDRFCESPKPVAEAGVEQRRITPKCGNDLQQTLDSSLAPSLALGANLDQIDQELAEVIAAWPILSETDRSNILGIIRSPRP
jgi:hypothetical protein